MQPAFHPTPSSARGRIASLSLGEGGSYAPPPEGGSPRAQKKHRCVHFARIGVGRALTLIGAHHLQLHFQFG